MRRGGFGDARRFIRFQGEGLRGGYGAKPAGPSAAIVNDHEGRGSFAPAFPVVGTFRTLANRVKFQFVEQRARV